MPKKIDTPEPGESGSFFTHIKMWITGLVGVLVVLPSLINAAVDVYSSLLSLPKTEAERINERLFRDNFGKQPVATIPVPIKQNNGLVEVRFQIYDKGDVFVQFGNFSQWFPFPAGDAVSAKRVGFSLIPSAYAQALPAPQGQGHYQQTEQMQGSAIRREKIYENGVVESQVIDTRSGDILDQSVRQTTQKQPLPPAPPAIPVSKVAPIDLDQYQKISQTAASGARPAKDPAMQWHEGLIAELAWCQEKSWSVSQYLCKYRATSKWCDQGNGWGKVKECAK